VTDQTRNESNGRGILSREPRKRRRWPQFGLRTVLFSITLIALGLGWYVNQPRLMLNGFCPVTLTEQETFASGSRLYTATYRGTRYRFVGARERDAFSANPDRYVVAFRGYDVVVAMHDKQLAPGDRKHGLWFRGKSYLFRDETTLQKFEANPRQYADFAYRSDSEQGEANRCRGSCLAPSESDAAASKSE